MITFAAEFGSCRLPTDREKKGNQVQILNSTRCCKLIFIIGLTSHCPTDGKVPIIE